MDSVSRLTRVARKVAIYLCELAVGLLAFSGAAHAQTSCYQWGGAGSSYFNSAGAALDSLIGAWTGSGAGNTLNNICGCTSAGCTISNHTLTAGTWPAYSYTVEYTVVNTGHVCTGSGGTILNRVKPGGCSACPASGSEGFVGGGSAAGTSCVGGCLYNTPQPAMKIFGGGASTPTVYESYSMGQSCGQTNDGALAKEGPEQKDCDSSGLICRDQSGGKNCGTYNGDRVCVGTVPPGTCVGYASGGVACVSAATGGTATPPNNGTAGTPATPDMSVAANGQTVNYYNNVTVNNSTATVSTAAPAAGGDPLGSSGNTAGAGGCKGGAEECGTGVASGGEACVTPPSCMGDAIQCAVLFQEWKSRCPSADSDADITAAVGETPEVGGSGEGDPPDLSEALHEDLVGDSSATCPEPPHIQLGGILSGVEFDFPAITWLCLMALKLAPLIVGLAYINAARVVFSGV